MIDDAVHAWQRKKVADLPIAIIDGDRSARYPKREEFLNEGFLFLNTKNIEDNRLNLSEVNYVSRQKYDQIKKGRVRPFDIVMTTRGSVGKIALFNCFHKTGLVNAQMLILRADGLLLDPIFLYYVMLSPNFQAKLKNFSSGSAQPQIPITDLREIQISYPSVQLQHKIASILSAYDDLIENNTRRIRILEEMAKTIYDEWFVKFRFPGHEKVKMVESELGMIPEGWEVKKLAELTSVITKGTTPTTLGKPFREEGLNFIKIESIGNDGTILENKLVKIDTETHELLKRSQLKKHDILFSIAGAIGRTALVPEIVLPANTNQALAIIRPTKKVFVHYIYRFVSSNEFINFSLGRVVQTAQANVSLSILSSSPVVVPSLQYLEQFDGIVSPITAMVEYLRMKNTNLRHTRDLLLPKLISGEIDVESLDIKTGEPDEPDI